MAVFRGALIEDASAEFRRQHQKLRGLPTELLAEFRGPARNARCERTQKGGLFPYFAGPALDFFSKLLHPPAVNLQYFLCIISQFKDCYKL